MSDGHGLAPDERASLPHRGASADAGPRPLAWKTNLALFVATVLSMFLTGAAYGGAASDESGWRALILALPHGWRFAVPLLAILVTHELGHFVAARYHRVDASLPYFIPLPLISPFGTMGAIIAMRGRIRSRNALLDIGASGPLLGLCVAIPVLVVGLMGSPVREVSSPGIQEGQSLLYVALKRVVLGPIPDGHDVFLSPVAFAGWTGLFVTALNLIPIGQLDGGHIAYALFGPRQDRYARTMHWGLLAMFALNIVWFGLPIVRSGTTEGLGRAFANSAAWLVWFALLGLLARVSGREHPPTEPGALSPMRRVIAAVSLALFALLFMPTPWATY